MKQIKIRGRGIINTKNPIIIGLIYGFVIGGIIGSILLLVFPSLSIYWPFEWSEFKNVKNNPHIGEVLVSVIVVCIFHILEGVLWGVCIGAPLGFLTGCVVSIKQHYNDNQEDKETEEC